MAFVYWSKVNWIIFYLTLFDDFVIYLENKILQVAMSIKHYDLLETIIKYVQLLQYLEPNIG